MTIATTPRFRSKPITSCIRIPKCDQRVVMLVAALVAIYASAGRATAGFVYEYSFTATVTRVSDSSGILPSSFDIAIGDMVMGSFRYDNSAPESLSTQSSTTIGTFAYSDTSRELATTLQTDSFHFASSSFDENLGNITVRSEHSFGLVSSARDISLVPGGDVFDAAFRLELLGGDSTVIPTKLLSDITLLDLSAFTTARGSIEFRPIAGVSVATISYSITNLELQAIESSVAVPEPSSLALLAAGSLTCVGYRRRRNRQNGEELKTED